MDRGWYRSWSFDKRVATVDRLRLARDAYWEAYGREPARCLLNPVRAGELPNIVGVTEIRSYPCILDDEVRLLVEEAS